MNYSIVGFSLENPRDRRMEEHHAQPNLRVVGFRIKNRHAQPNYSRESVGWVEGEARNPTEERWSSDLLGLAKAAQPNLTSFKGFTYGGIGREGAVDRAGR